jgi:hypothetical protein
MVAAHAVNSDRNHAVVAQKRKSEKSKRSKSKKPEATKNAARASRQCQI